MNFKSVIVSAFILSILLGACPMIFSPSMDAMDMTAMDNQTENHDGCDTCMQATKDLALRDIQPFTFSEPSIVAVIPLETEVIMMISSAMPLRMKQLARAGPYQAHHLVKNIVLRT